MLKKVDVAVWKETGFVAAVVVILSMLMQAVFLIFFDWNLTVLWGNLLGGSLAVLNFFLLALTVQKAVGLEENEAKTKIRVSQQLRLFMMLAVCAVGAALKCFDLVAMLLPLLFPRIAATIRGLTQTSGAEQDN